MTAPQLKHLRAALGWSQQRLADELGVARNTVARWEMDLNPIPKIAENFVRLLTKSPR